MSLGADTAVNQAPFRFSLRASEIEELRDRLARTRWPDAIRDTTWDYGASLDVVRRVCEHWATRYDFQAFIERANRFPQFTTAIDSQRLHFIHARSPEPGARPLLLLHGWPGSVAEFWEVIGPLSDPASHGRPREAAFHVVAPSLPGYGFSGPTTSRGWDVARIAAACVELMTGLRYGRFFCQGGDWGSLIACHMARMMPDSVAALQLSMLITPPPPGDGGSSFDAEELAATQAFMAVDSAYQVIQGSKPQTLAYGLSDSSSGLAAWILDKFHSWSGAQGYQSFAIDRILDNLSVYWFTGTINSSMRLYYETTGPRGSGLGDPGPGNVVPVSFSRYPDEPFRVPRRWIEANTNVVRWTDMPCGGHFPALQVPDLFVDEVAGFFAEQVL